MLGKNAEQFFFSPIRSVAASHLNPPFMNASAPLSLSDGIQSTLPSDLLRIGAGLIGEYQFSKTPQCCYSRVLGQSAVGALISSG
jgi:hypothetical protein